MGCGSSTGGCGCGGAGSATTTLDEVAAVNGVPLHAPGQRPDEAELRQRACTELLRQEAQRLNLLAANDPATGDGVCSAAASSAIEALLAMQLAVPTPDEAACRRHFEAHQASHARGERVQARHILFAVTPGVDVAALRTRAEGVLLEVRADPATFVERAATLSNCPSGAAGGALGELGREDCAPEFARELFGHAEVGVLPRLVHSRFGLHVVEVLARTPGEVPAFTEVRGAVAQALQQQAFATALRQYLAQLAGRADVSGIDLDAAENPLGQ